MHMSTLCFAAPFFVSLVGAHPAFFSQRAPLSSSSLDRTTSVVFLTFFLTLALLLLPSNVFMSDLIIPCHFAHLPQHALLTYLWSCLLSFRSCPGLCSVAERWSDHSCVHSSRQFHCHLPVAQHYGTSLPFSSCGPHSLCDFCHSSSLIHA